LKLMNGHNYSYANVWATEGSQTEKTVMSCFGSPQVTTIYGILHF